MQIGELLINSAKRFPDKQALVYEQGQITFSELYRAARWNAKQLKHLGIGLGDRVVIYADNGPEFLAGFFALQLLGAIPAAVYRLWTVPELKKVCDYIAADCIITEPANVELLRRAMPQQRIFGIEQERKMDVSCEVQCCGENDPALIRFTSGTTGIPKAVLFSHKYVTGRMKGSRWETADCCMCLTAFPFPIVRLIVALGCGVTILSLNKFSTKAAVAGIKNWGGPITWVWGTPGIIALLTNEIDDPGIFHNIGGFFSVGSYLPPNIQGTFQDKFGCPVYQNYGLTETQPLAGMPPGMPPRLGAIGKPLPGMEIIIDQPDANGVGKVLCRSSNDVLGYIKGTQLEKIPVTEDGWQITGDIGWFDSEDYLHVLGRAERLINIGGLKVPPSEIENVLYGHPAVKLAKVTSKRNRLLGEVPIAYVVAKEGCRLCQMDLKEYCSSQLAKYKIPRWFYIVDEIAMTVNGKLE